MSIHKGAGVPSKNDALQHRAGLKPPSLQSKLAVAAQESRAAQIRDVIRYIERFSGALAVIYMDDDVISSPLFTRHIRDISLLHKAGLKTVIVPGARGRISCVLEDAGVKWKMSSGVRITGEEAMPLVKMAAFDAAAPVMTALSAEHLTAVIGNYVRARGIGVVGTQDYGTAGRVESVDTQAVKSVLQSGFIPVFPCIGWSSAGRPYNISSLALAKEAAISLCADKLFFLIAGARVTSGKFIIPQGLGKTDIEEGGAIGGGAIDSGTLDSGTLGSGGMDGGTTDGGKILRIAAMDTREVDAFIAANQDKYLGAKDENALSCRVLSLLKTAKEACLAGVSRVHILDSLIDGAVPCEVFSDFGSGTMVYSSGYGSIRPLTSEDIPAVLSLMRPFVESGRLLPRTGRDILEEASGYIVYELDGGIRACAALHIYKGDEVKSIQAEIAAVAVDNSFSHLGIGPMLVSNLIERGKKAGAKSVFILTTQTADWFEHLGFKADSISSLPPSRRAKWSPKRGSKVYRLNL